jgi:hypothetical protein
MLRAIRHSYSIYQNTKSYDEEKSSNGPTDIWITVARLLYRLSYHYETNFSVAQSMKSGNVLEHIPELGSLQNYWKVRTKNCAQTPAVIRISVIQYFHILRYYYEQLNGIWNTVLTQFAS